MSAMHPHAYPTKSMPRLRLGLAPPGQCRTPSARRRAAAPADLSVRTGRRRSYPLVDGGGAAVVSGGGAVVAGAGGTVVAGVAGAAVVVVVGGVFSVVSAC